ncbi:MFS transporter [Nonomuraea sediminis]|uniref:MFS transporter n=1 Tax=Nonomuraea sediminis TaxID=2835864 RepID=UPI001BDD575A|nr:MFS transporter [Nonomuraea sediminis]
MMTTTRISPASLLTALILAITAYQLTITMTIPALPAITAGLGGDTGSIGLAQALFALAGALGTVFLPLSDRFGRRNALLVALVAGVLGSLLCALASGPGLFTAGRVLQGFGVVALPLSNLLIHSNLPAERFGRALGLLNMVNLGISGTDTILAGWLADTYGHRIIFWIMLVVQVVAVVTVGRLLPADEPDRTLRPDWTGMVTLALGVLTLLTGVSNSSTWGWTSLKTIGALIGGLVLLSVFVAVERRAARPMVQVGHLRSRRTWPLLLVPIFAMGALLGLIAFVLPIYGQNPQVGLGLSALEFAMLGSIPSSILAFVCAPIAGIIAPKVGWRRVLLLGLAGMAAGMIVLTAFLSVLWAVIICAALLGALFFGFASTAANGLAVLLSPKENPSFLPAMMSCAFSMGAALGISIAVSVLTGLGGASQGAFTATVGVLAGMAVLSLLAAALVPSPQHTPAEQVPA